LVVNATSGLGSLAALQAAGADNLAGKLLVDVANPWTSPAASRRVLSVSNDDSLGEQIQRAFPDARVVKTLNTRDRRRHGGAVAPAGPAPVFVSGDGVAAKEQVSRLLQSFGWPADDVHRPRGHHDRPRRRDVPGAVGAPVRRGRIAVLQRVRRPRR
jgi:predicted dinucleotide-binding enzyme